MAHTVNLISCATRRQATGDDLDQDERSDGHCRPVISTKHLRGSLRRNEPSGWERGFKLSGIQA